MVLEPVAVWEAKDHCRVTIPDDDVLIEKFITDAREEVEDRTRRAIMTQTWDYYLDDFPESDAIELPFGNLQSVTSVKYKDTDGAETTLTVTTDYLVETNGEQPGRIVLPYGGSWPSGPFYPSNPITIRFVCGWETQELVPSKIKAAIKLLTAKFYESRGENVVGQTVAEDLTFERLLASSRLWGRY
jgi:uncharacterized phiE125 gp8 family phage protein